MEITVRVLKHYAGRTRSYFHPKMSIIKFYLVSVFFYTANSISIRMSTISTPSVVFIKLQEIDCCIKLPNHDLTLTKHSRVGSSWFLINILLENLTTQSFVWAKIIL